MQYRLTDKQLNSEIKKSDTHVIAHYFDNVELYSSAMELTTAEEANARRVDGNQTAIMKCLQIWKQHNPSQATYRALLDIALRLGNRDTAHQICQQFTRRKYIYIPACIYVIPCQVTINPPLLSSYTQHNTCLK